MHQPTIDRLDVWAYQIPTDFPEADGTLARDFTAIVLVEVRAGGQRSLGYAYAHAAALIRDKLKGLIEGGMP
jgi:hypothetical protein